MDNEIVSIVILFIINFLSCVNLLQYYKHNKNGYYLEYFKYGKIELYLNILIVITSLTLIVFITST